MSVKITTSPVSVPISDQVLIERIKAHDQVAMSYLYDSYAKLVYVLAYRITRQAQEAEDIVIESFWQVWQQANQYNAERGQVRHWILTIARSRALDRIRALRRAPVMETELDHNLVYELQANDNPEHETWQTEQSAQVRTALEALPQKQREVLEMAYYFGLTQTEIADYLDEPLGTIKTRIRLAMQKMREELLYLQDTSHLYATSHRPRVVRRQAKAV